LDQERKQKKNKADKIKIMTKRKNNVKEVLLDKNERNIKAEDLEPIEIQENV
jgi:hypothetical protein